MLYKVYIVYRYIYYIYHISLELEITPPPFPPPEKFWPIFLPASHPNKGGGVLFRHPLNSDSCYGANSSLRPEAVTAPASHPNKGGVIKGGLP